VKTRFIILAAALAGFTASYLGGAQVAAAFAEYGPNETAYSIDGDYFYVQQRINYDQPTPHVSVLNQTEIWINVLGVNDSLSSGLNYIYEDESDFVDSKFENNSAYGWPMTYASTPDWDYFTWSYLGWLIEPIHTIYTSDGAGWNSRFDCCYDGWDHTKISY
jgi:hypothetical protein